MQPVNVPNDGERTSTIQVADEINPEVAGERGSVITENQENRVPRQTPIVRTQRLPNNPQIIFPKGYVFGYVNYKTSGLDLIINNTLVFTLICALFFAIVFYPSVLIWRIVLIILSLKNFSKLVNIVILMIAGHLILVDSAIFSVFKTISMMLFTWIYFTENNTILYIIPLITSPFLSLILFISKAFYLKQARVDRQENINRLFFVGANCESIFTRLSDATIDAIFVCKFFGAYKNWDIIFISVFIVASAILFCMLLCGIGFFVAKDYKITVVFIMLITWVVLLLCFLGFLLNLTKGREEPNLKNIFLTAFFYVCIIIPYIFKLVVELKKVGKGRMNYLRERYRTTLQVQRRMSNFQRFREVKEKNIEMGKARNLIKEYGHFNGAFFDLKHTLKTISSDEKCIICMINNPNTCYIPCKHGGVCKSCAIIFAKDKEECPICRVKLIKAIFYEKRTDSEYIEISEIQLN